MATTYRPFPPSSSHPRSHLWRFVVLLLPPTCPLPSPPRYHQFPQPPLPYPGDPDFTADLSLPVGLQQGLQFAIDFYSADSPRGLFRPRDDINEDTQAEFLSTLPRPLDPRYAALAEGVDGNGLLTTEELDIAIKSTSRGTTPGHDGLPFEVYSAFRTELTPILRRVYNAAFVDRSQDSPLSPLLQGTICLFPKSGQAPNQLASYRPITLLNCDLKIILLVMANRLQRPLDYVIDVTQSAFLRGRDISDNIRYHLGLVARLKELGLPGWLLHSDLTKAYDTADRGWLLKTMTSMGFECSGIVRWCQILMNGSTARVRVNGFLTTAFPTTSGLPQGGALSCDQWVILFQPFISFLNHERSNGRLHSFALPSGDPAPTSLSFADDAKVLVQDPETEGPVIKAAFQLAALAGLPEQSLP